MLRSRLTSHELCPVLPAPAFGTDTNGSTLSFHELRAPSATSEGRGAIAHVDDQSVTLSEHASQVVGPGRSDTPTSRTLLTLARDTLVLPEQ